MSDGYQPNGPATNEVTPPNTGSVVQKPRPKFRTVGIPLKEVGQRLQELNDAIREHNMAIGADAQYNLEFMECHDDMAKCVTMTVYFFSKDE